MPSKSKAQARLMAMVSHNPKMAKKTGVPVKVAKDFNQADKGTGILRGPVHGDSSHEAVTKAFAKRKKKG